MGPAVKAGLAVTLEGRADTASVIIPNNVGLFGDIPDHLHEMCIGLETSHFRTWHTVIQKQIVITLE